MRKNIKDGTQLFDTTLGATRRVDDDCLATNSYDPTRQAPKRVAESHCLGQSGRLSLDYGTGPFGCLVTWREAGATCGDDQAGKAVGHLD